MLRIENLTKSFNGLVAVDHISFHVQKGEIFGFLGPNGAGKTTTINMICSLLKPDGGSIFIDDADIQFGPAKLRNKLGVVPQETALYEELSAEENLMFWGSLYGMSGKALKTRVAELLELTGLQERAGERVKNYSGGMKRRLNMAAGMIHTPKLLLLDEPTVGIDPQARHNMLEMVRDVARKGTTILYTTHYMEEAELLCDRLAIIDHGRILVMGTQQEIQQVVGENRLLKVSGTFSPETAELLAKQIAGLTLVSLKEKELVYGLPVKFGTGQFIEKLVAAGFKIDNLSIKEPNLDTVFLKLTGRELRD
ncbi:MAG: ATP-binding cassette domain-containing protein [Actinobacteria bacterium]|nr:ATP-binding cassette domain-containing protein [Actinomycetota bacterium]